MEAVVRETDLADLGAYRSAFGEAEHTRRIQPPWLQHRRAEAFRRFFERGFPSHGQEDWRFTNVRPIATASWAPATGRPAHPGVSEPALAPYRIPDAIELVFVNGRFSPELSRLELSDSLRISRLVEEDSGVAARLEPWLGQIAPQAPFADLNTAFFEDGALVEIAAGAVISRPVHLLFATEEEEMAAFSSPRVLVVAGPESQAALVETYLGAGSALAWTNAVTEISVGQGAVLEHSKLQLESTSGYHIHSLAVQQERASNFTSHNLAFGSALARTDLLVTLAGEGGECTLNGLFVGNGTQHLDNHTVIDHATPHCVSRELYKGILDGRSRGVFTGRIIVRPDAQKTDAMQTNKNLLLSREALVDSIPALEIRADDVRCKHGSTIGQLDAAALFYLRSRGIGEAQARELLTRAFAADVADRIRIPAIRAAVSRVLGARLPAGEETR